MENTDLINYLTLFDIVALLETLVTDIDKVRNMLVGYNCFDIPAFKYENQGRPMGGILVFVRSKFKKHFKRVQSECKFAVFIRAEKSLFNTTKDILFSFTYIPPDSSNAYKHESFKGIDMFENYLLACDNELNEVFLAIVGDLNSRTADKFDFIPQEQTPPELEECIVVKWSGFRVIRFVIKLVTIFLISV